MSKSVIRMIPKAFARTGICILTVASFILPPATIAGAKPGFHPEIIRGIPKVPAELRLAYLATFPRGSLEPWVDKLNLGAMCRRSADPEFEPDRFAAER